MNDQNPSFNPDPNEVPGNTPRQNPGDTPAQNQPDLMTVAEFEQRLPEFFATGTGRVSDDPRFQAFLLAHPDSAALVRDLEYIAEHARSLFEPADDAEPSDAVWDNIQNKLSADAADPTADPDSDPPSNPSARL